MRKPRPIGLTQLNLSLLQGKETKEERERRLKEALLKIYISSSFRLNGEEKTLPEIQREYGIREEESVTVMLEVAPGLIGLTETETPDKVMRALAASVLAWAQEDRKAAITQLGLLADSQGDTYKPFVSAEVTKALKVSQEATSNMMKAVQAITGAGPQGGTTINILNQGQNQEARTEGLTTDQALHLLDEAQPKGLTIGNTQEAQDYLDQQQGLPEVNGRTMASEAAVPQIGGLTTGQYKSKSLRASERDGSKEGSMD